MAKKSLKKGDIVRMNYDAYIADNERLYDTTYEEKAKENEMYNEQYKYAPMPYIVGSGKLFPALDAEISAAEIGKHTVVEIPFEEGAGASDPKLFEVHPLREFHKQEINPYPGLEVSLGDRRGTVVTVGAGRVKVDFNNPLAGKNLRYEFEITEIVDGDEDKAKAILDMDFGTSDGFGFEFGDDKVSVRMPDLVKFNQGWPMSKFRIVSDLRDAFGINTVEFIETWTRAPSAADKDAAEEPASEEEK